MAVGPNNQPIPKAVLAGLPWPELVERLTAVAQVRLRGPIDDAKQLAMETVKVFLDPKSAVTWDYITEPDGRRCLGSILNGLLRNFVRKRTNLERPTTDQDLEAITVETIQTETPEDLAVARDLFKRVLDIVADLSKDDPIVIRLIPLFERGLVEVDEQAADLSLSKGAIYEARRRMKERIELARRTLGEEQP